MINVGIVGGTGYTGVELLRILSQHPEVNILTITSRSEAGMDVADLFTNLRGQISLKFCDPTEAELDQCDLVFVGQPRFAFLRRHSWMQEPESSIWPPISASRMYRYGKSGTVCPMPALN